MTAQRAGAVVAGLICLDIIPQLPPVDVHARLKPGKVIEIGRAMLATGGAVSNTGRALHKLGIPTRLMGKVGDDPFGRIILDLVRAEDLALAGDMVVAAGETSSYTIVISPQDVDRSFMHCAGANHTFGADDVDYQRLKSAWLFHFGYPPYMERVYADDGAELVEMFRRAKETGVITSLDMALPDPQGPSGQVDWRRVLARVLPYVDLFLPSLDELLFMLGHEMVSPEQAAVGVLPEVAAEVLNMGADVVVLKLGDRGLYFRTGPGRAPFSDDVRWQDRELWVPCFEPEPFVGTTGAGDTTIAGLLAGILRGQMVEDALTGAVAVGACNVEAADALGGIRSWEETQARIRAGWARQPVAIEASGWWWHAGHALWVGPRDRYLSDEGQDT